MKKLYPITIQLSNINISKKNRLARLSRFQRSTAITDTVLSYRPSIEGRNMINNSILKKPIKPIQTKNSLTVSVSCFGMIIEEVECRSKYVFQENVVRFYYVKQIHV